MAFANRGHYAEFLPWQTVRTDQPSGRLVFVQRFRAACRDLPVIHASSYNYVVLWPQPSCRDAVSCEVREVVVHADD
jgi:hypothetical protein